MKFHGFLFLLFVLFIGKIYSQDLNSYLVSLPIDNDNINNQIEKLNLPILHMTEDQLITIITSENMDALKILGLDYFVLDDYSPGDKYFLISSKFDEDISSKLLSENLVYKDFNSVIAKNLALKPEEAVLTGLIVIELNDNQTFKNERRIWKSDFSLLSDSLISQITSSVNSDSIRFFIRSLQDFQTKTNLFKWVLQM